MKLQDVLLKAMAKKITWWEAAEIIGVTDRTMRRWRERLEAHGYSGLVDRRKGKPSDRRVPVAKVEEMLGLYRDTYFDLNMRHFHEKLSQEHGIQLSYTFVQKALQGAGLVARGRKRRKHRRRRERRPMPGMLLHIDGSQLRWFQDERQFDLIVILDDATSEIYYAQLVDQESTRTAMAGIRHVVETKGWFSSLYSDRASHFFRTPKAGEPVDTRQVTEVGRALKDVGIEPIPAYSPQARGRSERNFGTGKAVYPRNSGSVTSKPSMRRITFFGATTLRNSIASSPSLPLSKVRPLFPCSISIWIESFRFNMNAWSARTTRSTLPIVCCKFPRHGFEPHWPVAVSRCTNI